MRKSIYFSLILLFTFSLLGKAIMAAEPDSLVTNYFKAYNSGNPETMAGFLSKYMSETNFKKVSPDERKERYKTIYEDIGAVEVVGIDENNSEITASVKTRGGGIIQFIFMLDSGNKNKFTGIRIEAGEKENGQPVNVKKTSGNPLADAKKYLNKLALQNKFSGAALIAQNGKIVFEKAYGYADKEKKIPNKIDTRFNLGSIIKKFTQNTILLLADQKKLSLDDNLIKFLPDYPNKEAAEAITIKQLLNHTSGVTDFFNKNYEAADRLKIKSISDYLPLFVNEPLWFKPGTGKEYSNGGYILLGAIIEKVTGENYYDFIAKNIFTPAGMKSSGFFEKDKLPANTAKGYIKDAGSKTGFKSNFDSLPGKGSSAGGGYSTLHDLFSYINACKDGIIISNNKSGGIAMAGGAPGLNAAIEWEPDLVVIVLANLDPPAATETASAIAKMFR